MKTKKFFIDFSKGVKLTILCSILTIFIVLALDGNSFIYSGDFIVKFFYNYFSVFSVFIISYYLSNNFILSNGLSMLIFIILAVVNKIKIFFRGAPLFHYDYMLTDELAGIAKSVGYVYIFTRILIILLSFAMVFILAYFIKTNKCNLKKRLLIAGIFTAFFLVMNNTVLSDKQVYDDLEIYGNKYDIVDQYNSKGFIYSFVYNFNNSKIEVPSEYNKVFIENEMKKLDNEIKDYDVLPTIIMIQSEAYSELGMNEKINFENYDDPYKNYKNIVEQSFYGEMVVPNIGGGTSDTEFDILTGMNTRFLTVAPYSNILIKDKTESIPSLLKSVGYYTVAMHPGDSWFYGREEVFENFGFDEFITIDSFDKSDTKGMYITEEKTFDNIIKTYEKHREDNDSMPYFSFNITIQNHGPFIDKYKADKNFDTEVNFSDNELNALANYFVGINDIDMELKKLIDFFENENTPVIVVYWSDHQPSVPPNVFEELLKSGDSNDVLNDNLYKVMTPYFIWENSSSKSEIGIVEKLSNSNLSSTISSFYLSSVLFNALGMDNISYFVDYNIKMMEEYPILLKNDYYNKDTLFNRYEDDDKVNYYKDLIYYRLFDIN